MSRDVCALDFSASSIHLLVRRRGGRVDGTEALLPAEAIQEGKILQPVAVQLYVSRLLKDLKLKKAELRLCISDSSCVSRFLEFPRMPDRDLVRSLRFEATRELPMNPRSVYLGWQVVERQPDRETVLLVGAWRDLIDGYLEAVSGIGPVTVVEPRSLALARAVGLDRALLAEWTGDLLQVAVVDRRRVTYTTSAMVSNGAAGSVDRLAHVLASLLPKAGGRDATLPRRMVLLGRLAGRDDMVPALERFMETSSGFEALADWRLPEPFANVGLSQAANVGLLLRGRDE